MANVRQMVLPLGLAASVTMAAPAQAYLAHGTFRLDATQAVPEPTGADTASGRATMELEQVAAAGAGVTYTLRYDITLENLTGPPVAAHVHSGAVGVVGEIEHGLRIVSQTSTGGALVGTIAELTPAEVQNLLGEQYYVNVHTARNAAGEIRGQIRLEGSCVCGGDGKQDRKAFRACVKSEIEAHYARRDLESYFADKAERTEFSRLVKRLKKLSKKSACGPVRPRRLACCVPASSVGIVAAPHCIATKKEKACTRLGGTIRADAECAAIENACSPTRPPCAERARACTLGEWASEVGFFVGAISGDRPMGPSVILDPDFSAAVRRHFNSITAENVLKWGPLAPAPGVYDFEQADLVVDFAEANDLRLRGHALLWARFNGVPPWLAGDVNGADDPGTRLRDRIEAHVASVVGRYRGRIAVWDVVNEPLDLLGTALDPESLFTQRLGAEYLDIAFDAARRADPDAVLAMNETLVIDNDAKFGALLDVARGLVARGAPIDVIGLQGQFILGPPPSRGEVRARLEAVAALGLSVEITELSIPIGFYAGEADPLAAQAAAFAAVFGACLDVPACTGVTTWGVYDAETWLDEFFPFLAPARPLLLDEGFGRKPAYEAVLALFAEG